MKYQKSNFKSIGKLIEPIIKRHGEVNSVSHSRLFKIWETIVGEDVSRKAHPISIKSSQAGKKNILHLGMSGPYMAELSLQKFDIIEKINAYYSKEVIVQIKLHMLPYTNEKNVVGLDDSYVFEDTKSEELMDPKTASAQLETALTRMKNNISNSRKKNEITED